jgi:predicted HD phosphohydrolase
VSISNHAAVAAEIVKPYVSDDVYWVIKTHDDFQGIYYNHFFGGEENPRAKYEGEPWYDLAVRFSDEWDQKSFDPDYDTEPLEHFEPMVREVFARPERDMD